MTDPHARRAPVSSGAGFRPPVCAAGPSRSVCRRATTVLVLGASSVVFSWTGIAVLAAVASLLLGVRARRELRTAAGALAGERMVLTGTLLAVSALALTVVLVLLGVLTFVGRPR